MYRLNVEAKWIIYWDKKYLKKAKDGMIEKIIYSGNQ